MQTSLPSVWIIGMKGLVGSLEVSVHELAEKFKTSASKITKLTGIKKLRRLSAHETLVGLAAEASRMAIKHSGLSLSDISGVYGSSNPTSETIIPTFTTAVAHELKLKEVISDHIGLGCGGAMQALKAAYNQLVVDALWGRPKNYLVVTGDQTSRILDPEDRDNAFLFGEGVAAVVLTNYQRLEGAGAYRIASIGTKSLLGDNLHSIELRNPYDPANGKNLPMFQMEGRRVFNFGVKVIDHIFRLTGFSRLPPNTYLITHQPNLRMLKAMAKYAEICPRKMYMNGIRTIGNTSPCAFLLGLEDALLRNLFDWQSNNVILGTFGAELQVGAALLVPHGDPRKILY